MDNYIEELNKMRKSLYVSVKIDHEEQLKIVVNDLIAKRNCHPNKIRDAFDAVLRYYITEDEFEKYVIRGEEIEQPTMKPKFENGTEVYWTDPDNGISSGEYTVMECCSEDGEDSIYLIANENSEAEVLECELKSISNDDN